MIDNDVTSYIVDLRCSLCGRIAISEDNFGRHPVNDHSFIMRLHAIEHFLVCAWANRTRVEDTV